MDQTSPTTPAAAPLEAPDDSKPVAPGENAAHRDLQFPHSRHTSVVAAPPPNTGSVGGGVVTVPAPVGETCPLCGGSLHPEQEWCLRCGAAARTRLAASSNRKAPIIALAAVAALSLGVLAASVVKLAGGFGGSAATPATVTVAASPAAVSPTTPTAKPGGTATLSGATTPGATTPRASTPGAVTPRARTTTPGQTGTSKAPALASPGTSTSGTKRRRVICLRKGIHVRCFHLPAAEIERLRRLGQLPNGRGK